jgi:amino acid permease
VGGRDASDKVFGVFSALGTVVFAFGFSLIVSQRQRSRGLR